MWENLTQMGFMSLCKINIILTLTRRAWIQSTWMCGFTTAFKATDMIAINPIYVFLLLKSDL